jgi:hypothetical protein
MIAVRAWRRQLYRGLGAAVFVPATLVAALMALAFAGGFARIGALGQAFSGPPLPATSEPVAGVGSRGVHLPDVRGQALTTAARPRSASAATTVAPARRGAASGSAPTSGTASPPSPGFGGGHQGNPAAPSPAPSAPPASPPPRPTLIDGIVGAGTPVTQSLPAPAGPASTGALQAAGSAADAIAPVPAP